MFGKLGGLPSVLFEFNIGRVLERLRRQDKRKEKSGGVTCLRNKREREKEREKEREREPKQGKWF